MKIFHTICKSCFIFLLVLVVWEYLVLYKQINAYLLPKPMVIVETMKELVVSGEFTTHLLISLQRVFWGYFLAIIIAIILTILFCTSNLLKSILEPPLNFIRQIPPLALLPLLLIWLGIGEEQKITIIILGCFFPIFYNFVNGIKQVDTNLVAVAKIFNLSKSQQILQIYLPSALPSILVGLRLGLGFSWRSLVGAELIASSAGLGYMMLDAENMARTDIVLVGVITIGILGIMSDKLLACAMQIISPWHFSESLKI